MVKEFVPNFASSSPRVWMSLLLAATSVHFGCAGPVTSTALEEEARSLECSLEDLGALGPLDIVVAFDNALASQDPSGLDVDGDGVVGAIQSSVFTDRDDSWLGVEVDAARRLIRNASGHDVRFSVVTYSNRPFLSHRGRSTLAVGDRDARAWTEMTEDAATLEAALDRIMEIGSEGSANFYAGVRRANDSLIKARDRKQPRRMLTLFSSNIPGPRFHDHGRVVQGGIAADLARAGREANRHDIVVNSFGVGENSDTWSGLSLGLIARITGGTYHAVQDPAQLYCHFVDSILSLARQDSEFDSARDDAATSEDSEFAE